MNEEPFEAVSSALIDPCRWIRLGAAAAAPYLAPLAAAGLLTKHAAGLSEPLPVDEAATIAVALARAGGDPLPLTARLLHDSAANVRAALEAGGNQWAIYVNTRIASGSLPRGPYPLVQPLIGALIYRGSEVWGVRFEPAPNAPRADKACADVALSRFKWYRNLATLGAPELEPVVARTFGGVVALLSEGNIAPAIGPLVAIALTAPSFWMRWIAWQTLPALGADASAPLLVALAGGESPRPDDDVFQSIKEESDGIEALERMTPETLAAFFAGEALEEFTDKETAFAVTRAAIAWRGEPQARAARVAARMSADVGLPPLFWFSLHLPAASERRSARTLLDRIIAKDDSFGMRFHRIGTKEIFPGHLDWLMELASRPPGSRVWDTDPSVAFAILREAIAVVPEIAGTTNFQYHAGNISDHISLSKRSVSALRQLFSGWNQRSTEQPRYPEINFPNQCTLGVETTLSVRLLPNKPNRFALPFKVPFAKREEVTRLLVLIGAPGFYVSPDYAELQVPREGKSSKATFQLRPRDKGGQAIDVKFLLGNEEIGHCCVMTQVVAADAHRGKAATAVLTSVTGESMQLQSDAKAYLRIKTEDKYLQWATLESDGSWKALGRSPDSFGHQERSDWVGTQAPLIRKMLEIDLPEEELAGVFAQLRAIGNTLYAQIAPQSLAGELAGLQDDAVVVVDSDADWIPWELLASHPNERLWGERFVLVRAPRVTVPTNVKVSPPGTISSTLNRALLVIGDGINQPNNVRKLTFGAMARLADPLIEKSWLELRAAVEGKDIVHFACHGRSDPLYHLSYATGVGSRLLPKQAHDLGLKWGAIVFANACSSGAAELVLADFQSFGREFYCAGARPFIGTLGPVPEKEAVEFAALFYQHFSFAGLPAGQALRQARLDAAKRFKKPIWLFYCLYGNPSVARVWSAG